MPTGIPKSKPASKDDVLQLAEAIKNLETNFASRLVTIEERLSAMEKPKEELKPIVPGFKGEELPKPAEATPPVAATPVPFEWRQVVDEVLNSDFGIQVTYLDGGRFECVIDVPKKYSNATAREWDMNHYDHRVKVMQTFLGAQGVKDYCELIAKNLGETIMKQVHDDKQNHV